MHATTTEQQVTIKLTQTQIQLALCYLEIERDQLVIGKYQLSQDEYSAQRFKDLSELVKAIQSAL